MENKREKKEDFDDDDDDDLRETAFFEDGEGVLGGVDEVGDVMKRAFLGSEQEDGSCFCFLGEACSEREWELRRVQASQYLPIQR